VLKFLQGSVIIRITLGGLTIKSLTANFLQCTAAKNCENWLIFEKLLPYRKGDIVTGPPCICAERVMKALSMKQHQINLTQLYNCFCTVSL